MKLPSHNRLTQTLPDPMHTVKDVIEHIFNLITGKEDNQKVRQAEAAIDRFGIEASSESSEDDDPDVPRRTKHAKKCCRKKKLPDAVFRLTSDDIKLANERCQMVNYPSPDFTPGPIFTKASGLKSHDWKEVCCNITYFKQ